MSLKKLKPIKLLGYGLNGTTYLVKWEKKKYAMKVQKMLKKEVGTGYKKALGRELDFYQWIETLSDENRSFFMRLYQYEIDQTCKHIQKRDIILHPKMFESIDKSKICVRYLLDYHGNETLATYTQKKRLTTSKLYSILLQICKIGLTLYEAGYSHGDFHMENFMIEKTKEKTYTLMGKKVKYHGLKLTLIDYGSILNKKYHILYPGYVRDFLRNREAWLHYEIVTIMNNLLANMSQRIYTCHKKKKSLPWQINTDYFSQGIIHIINQKPEFWYETMRNMVELYPASRPIMEDFMKRIIRGEKNIFEGLALREGYSNYFMVVLSNIIMLYTIEYPKEEAKNFLWCVPAKFLVSKNILQKIVKQNTLPKLIHFLNSQ